MRALILLVLSFAIAIPHIQASNITLALPFSATFSADATHHDNGARTSLRSVGVSGASVTYTTPAPDRDPWRWVFGFSAYRFAMEHAEDPWHSIYAPEYRTEEMDIRLVEIGFGIPFSDAESGQYRRSYYGHIGLIAGTVRKSGTQSSFTPDDGCSVWVNDECVASGGRFVAPEAFEEDSSAFGARIAITAAFDTFSPVVLMADARMMDTGNDIPPKRLSIISLGAGYQF